MSPSAEGSQALHFIFESANVNYSTPVDVIPQEQSGGGDCNGRCQCADSVVTEPRTEGCSTPIILDSIGNGFTLTSAADGVDFDFNGDGSTIRTAWTNATSDDAFLILDRNGNGVVDNGTELFGNYTPQPSSRFPNGYNALAEYDQIDRGGNEDGKISALDSIYFTLQLWRDLNHNGFSEPEELNILPEMGVSSISLDYKLSKHVDKHGNRFLYRANVSAYPGYSLGPWSWDVIFANDP
ncbi:MAG: hypothetical protein KME03_17755 [Aphanocapsa lilacina HA4352-LM1]|jgi:hypothetical protein|nr:hypothetical protein [Aphanocapsa lilacina HA4352-LM1]